MYFLKLFLLAIFFETWPISNAESPNCSNIFHFNYDETNRIESGSLQFLLEEKYNFKDVKIEVVFGFKELHTNVNLICIDFNQLRYQKLNRCFFFIIKRMKTYQSSI